MVNEVIVKRGGLEKARDILVIIVSLLVIIVSLILISFLLNLLPVLQAVQSGGLSNLVGALG